MLCSVYSSQLCKVGFVLPPLYTWTQTKRKYGYILCWMSHNWKLAVEPKAQVLKLALSTIVASPHTVLQPLLQVNTDCLFQSGVSTYSSEKMNDKVCSPNSTGLSNYVQCFLVDWLCSCLKQLNQTLLSSNSIPCFLYCQIAQLCFY